MKNFPDKISLIFIFINIILLLYYSFQLLIYTDEFANSNLGSFNHAIAGLSEIIGIIFICLSFGLFMTIIKGLKNQIIIFMTILIMELLISLNLWRYVLTNSPGETSLNIIVFNALIFSFMFLLLLFVTIRLKNYF